MMRKKILVDENVPLAEEYFGQLGQVQRFSGRRLSAPDVVDAHALIVRSVTQVNAALLNHSAVEFVGTCTIGIDHLDTTWLNGQRIPYTNAPGCNANSVVEYVLTALARLDVNWQGRKVGIVGCGNVGGRVFRRLAALGAEVAGYDPLLPEGSLPVSAPLASIFESDIVCLHAPLTTTGTHPTRHMITEDLLRRLPHGAVLISAGRGPVICNKTLLNVADVRPDVRWVLDVWEHEPWLDPALLHRAAIGTPHIAGYSYDGKVMGTKMVCEALANYWGQTIALAGESGELAPVATVDVPRMTAAEWQQVRKVMCEAYDLAGDDRRLRELVAQAQQSDDPETHLRRGFDLLRKHYPERREFRHFRWASEHRGDRVEAMIRALGFAEPVEVQC